MHMSKSKIIPFAPFHSKEYFKILLSMKLVIWSPQTFSDMGPVASQNWCSGLSLWSLCSVIPPGPTGPLSGPSSNFLNTSHWCPLHVLWASSHRCGVSPGPVQEIHALACPSLPGLKARGPCLLGMPTSCWLRKQALPSVWHENSFFFPYGRKASSLRYLINMIFLGHPWACYNKEKKTVSYARLWIRTLHLCRLTY